MTTPGGFIVITAPPSGLSARNAMTPPGSTPVEPCSHGDTGISNKVVPSPYSIGRAPVKRLYGAGGELLSSLVARSRSSPESLSHSLLVWTGGGGSRPIGTSVPLALPAIVRRGYRVATYHLV